jgi:hypothetical protein
MQRLALLDHLARAHLGNTPVQGQLQRRRTPRLRAQAIVLAWFSLGVLASGGIGFGAVIGLRAVADGKVPISWTAWLGAPAVASPAPSIEPAADHGWTTYHVAIERNPSAPGTSPGTHVPLPLQLSGSDDPAVEVLLGLPVGVRPSRGEMRGETTWLLKRADLDGLLLELDTVAPAAFDVRIVVLAPAGLTAASSVVHVLLVDVAPRKQAAGGRTDEPLQVAAQDKSDGPFTDVAKSPPARTGDKDVPPQRRVASAKADPGGARTWPEGAYGLGAMPREGERQTWWEMPPSWSPFQDRP